MVILVSMFWLCSALPTYDEDSQKSGRVFIYFDTEDGKPVGSAEVEGKEG
jgi:hypothetical protein